MYVALRLSGFGNTYPLNCDLYLMDSVLYPLTNHGLGKRNIKNSHCCKTDTCSWKFNTQKSILQTWTESLPIGPSKPGDGNCDGTPP